MGEKSIRCITNENVRNKALKKASLGEFSKESLRDIRNFHKSFAEYRETPLQDLKALSVTLGAENLWMKDESYRFGLNAFKVLGGSYAIGKYLAKELNMDISELSFEKLRSKEVRDKLGDLTFVTATDGNHGKGVAWAARQLGQKAVVFMPKGSVPARLESIQKEGAEASITDMNYDDTVRYAKQYAREHNGVVIQDGAREDYREIPTWIIQGYTTIIDEAIEQIGNLGKPAPTHVFLQAGVGSFAAGIVAYLVSAFGEDRPIIVIVEPDEAACFYLSMQAGDGKPHAVTGFMPTIMAGLACGDPCILSWEILKDYTDYYISCSDAVAVEGMRALAYPLPGDPKIVSGESGAVGLGLVKTVLQEREFDSIREQLKLNGDSRVLLINTEGDTDPENYAKIVKG